MKELDIRVIGKSKEEEAEVRKVVNRFKKYFNIKVGSSCNAEKISEPEIPYVFDNLMKQHNSCVVITSREGKLNGLGIKKGWRSNIEERICAGLFDGTCYVFYK